MDTKIFIFPIMKMNSGAVYSRDSTVTDAMMMTIKVMGGHIRDMETILWVRMLFNGVGRPYLEVRKPYYGMRMLFKQVGRPYYGVNRPYYGMRRVFMGRVGCIRVEGGILVD